MVRARRRGEQLLITELSAGEQAMAVEMADQMLSMIAGCEGQSIEDVEAALGQIERAAKFEKVWAGLKKIILDDCEFGGGLSIDPPTARRVLFQRAAELRAQLSEGESFPRNQLLADVAAELEISVPELEDGLFADLKGAQLLKAWPRRRAEELVLDYETQHIQGVLLRSVKLTATVTDADPAAYRRLFHKLKFRNLLFRLSKLESGYQIEIEGPFSLFEAVTKYGMQFALLLPALLECGRGHLVAELRWGKERRALRFERKWDNACPMPADGPALPVRSEIEQLIVALRTKKSPFEVQTCSELLHIPGEGLCVPDLKFSAPGRRDVYLELMGFWSRDALWRRIEWAQSGEHERVVFAASARLRVSEEVLPEGTGSSLYVFKGVMSPSAVLKHVEALSPG
jgi:predicted nuclease of restriction endonuclease-like RecB superfamily